MSKRKPPVIAITGANGFLGSILTDYFLQEGWHVVALVRKKPSGKARPGLSYRTYDIRTPLGRSTLEGVDYTVHTAYIKSSRKNPDAFEANVRGAEYLLTAAREAGVRKNIFISSMSSHDNAVSAYGRQKRTIEELFRTPTDVNLRLGLIIGNGGIVRDMVDFMRSKHLVPLSGGGRQPLQIIGVHDVGKAISKVIRHDSSGILTLATPRVYTYREFYATLASYLHIRVVFVPVPAVVLILLLTAAEALRLPLDISAENVRGLRKLTAADTRGDLKKLGLKLNDLEASLRAAGLGENN